MLLCVVPCCLRTWKLRSDLLVVAHPSVLLQVRSEILPCGERSAWCTAVYCTVALCCDVAAYAAEVGLLLRILHKLDCCCVYCTTALCCDVLTVVLQYIIPQRHLPMRRLWCLS